jgi:hypothetical protein
VAASGCGPYSCGEGRANRPHGPRRAARPGPAITVPGDRRALQGDADRRRSPRRGRLPRGDRHGAQPPHLAAGGTRPRAVRQRWPRSSRDAGQVVRIIADLGMPAGLAWRCGLCGCRVLGSVLPPAAGGRRRPGLGRRVDRAVPDPAAGGGRTHRSRAGLRNRPRRGASGRPGLRGHGDRCLGRGRGPGDGRDRRGHLRRGPQAALTTAKAQAADIVITMGCGEACPVYLSVLPGLGPARPGRAGHRADPAHPRRDRRTPARAA